MKPTKFFAMTLAAALLATTAASAQTANDSVNTAIADLQSQGYSRIEVRVGNNGYQIEASGGAGSVHQQYDANGTLISSTSGGDNGIGSGATASVTGTGTGIQGGDGDGDDDHGAGGDNDDDRANGGNDDHGNGGDNDHGNGGDNDHGNGGGDDNGGGDNDD